MESAHLFNNRFEDNMNTTKMELERNNIPKHSKNIQNIMFTRRNINSSYFNKNKNNFENNIIQNEFNLDLINNNISQVLYLFEKIHQNNMMALNKNQINEIKSVLLNYLTQIRKELSKENIKMIQAKNIFDSNNTKIFSELLINPINDTYDPFIQLESIWIINNLMFLVAKYRDIISFEVFELTKLLIQYFGNIYKNQNNDGVKYTLEEKILRIFGNLLYIDNNILTLLKDYEIIPFIVGSLNSPIPSFRITCLWLINKILLTFKKIGNINFISYFNNKIAISNYKFILSRIQNQNSLDEISELFWIINELVKYDSTILIPIFFADINNTILNKEYSVNKFQYILDNCFTNKMLQPCLRLISNLLIICYKDIKDEDLLSKLIQIFFKKESILRLIKEFMNSPKNKFDYSLSKDIFLLIFNLVSISPDNSIINFKGGISNLINNKEYQNDKKMMTILIYTYYKIMKSSNFYFETKDEIVIKSCFCLMENFKNDEGILFILIDLFYFYLKASNINIDGNIENELKIIINTRDSIPINNLFMLLFKLSDFVQMKINSI